ncbi:hypothetical protein ACQKWADRAFT_293652 [Trichoderma austrokoningii]
MKNIIQSILPVWQSQKTTREHYQLAADNDRLALSLDETRGELQQAKSELKRVHGDLHRADSEMRQLKNSAQHCQTELQASQVEISRLQDKERSMRDFLIENNHNQIVSDRDVCERFAQLRQRIQRLASNKAYNIEDFHNLELDERWFQSKYVQALWGASPKSGRLVILRSLLFQFLYANILNKLLFGVSDAKTGPTLERLCAPLSNLSQPLSLFERVIGDHGVNHDILINWRLSTFKCIESAGLCGSDDSVNDGDAMFSCFQVFISEKATPQQIEKLRKGYHELCKEAWALQLLMRSSLEPFECYVSPGYLLRGLEDRYEAIGEISHVAGTTGDFAFPIFGALIKHTKVQGNGGKVLEKAQCIVAVPSS